MGFLRNRLLRRFSPLGRVADLALVASLGMRLAQRKGWISEDQAQRFGVTGQTGSAPGLGQMAIAGAAALRLLRRRRRR